MCNLMHFPGQSYCINQDTPATGDQKVQKPAAGEAADLRSNSPGEEGSAWNCQDPTAQGEHTQVDLTEESFRKAPSTVLCRI